MALSTASRVCGRTAWASLSTLETVWCETPARWATSAMVGAPEAAVMTRILVRPLVDRVAVPGLCTLPAGADALDHGGSRGALGACRAIASPVSTVLIGRSAVVLVTTPAGTLDDGTPVTAYTVSATDHGVQLTVLDLGATIARLRMPLRDNDFVDVALGLPAARDYAAPTNPYLGATVGRYANRIGEATFTLDGVRHDLAPNEGTTCLHGGPDGFSARRWSVVASDDKTIDLELRSPDGDQGFPGTVTARVRYSVGPDTVTIEHLARTDAPTVVSLTNHAYLNLAGEGTVDDHRLTVHADAYLPVDAASIPLGREEPVEGGPFDLREPAELGPRIRSPHPQVRLASAARPRLRAARVRAAARRPARAPADRTGPRRLHHPAVAAGLHRQPARRDPHRPGWPVVGAVHRHRPGVPGLPRRAEPARVPLRRAAAR